MTLLDSKGLEPTPEPVQLRSLVGYLIAPVFLLTAAWFMWGPDPVDRPLTDVALFPRDEITTKPVRQVLSDPPGIIAGGYRLKCSECHRLFESPEQTPVRLMEHRHIKLNHGLTDRCLDCHDKENRNELALAGGVTVPFDNAPRLCGKCHGPTYRDWQDGMHGRTNGYWDQTRGERQRLSCVQCHDPHSPAFGWMLSLPGPNTLRMGDPSRVHEEEDTSNHNPLRYWNRKSANTQGEHE